MKNKPYLLSTKTRIKMNRLALAYGAGKTYRFAKVKVKGKQYARPFYLSKSQYFFMKLRSVWNFHGIHPQPAFDFGGVAAGKSAALQGYFNEYPSRVGEFVRVDLKEAESRMVKQHLAEEQFKADFSATFEHIGCPPIEPMGEQLERLKVAVEHSKLNFSSNSYLQCPPSMGMTEKELKDYVKRKKQ